MAAQDDPAGHYRALGLAPNATQAQISHAYREWAKAFHPDNRDTPTLMIFTGSRKPTTRCAMKVVAPSMMRWDLAADRMDHRRIRRQPRRAFGQASLLQRRHVVPPATRSRRSQGIAFSTGSSAQSCIVTLNVRTVSIVRGARRAGRCANLPSRQLLGWWSIAGIVHTPAALWRNFCIGEKPPRKCPFTYHSGSVF